MAKRDQLIDPFSRHNAGDLGDGHDVALGNFTVPYSAKNLGAHSDLAVGNRLAKADGL